jgi:predicted CXXCH cytochrome family protein
MQIGSKWLVFLLLGFTTLSLWYCSSSTTIGSTANISPFRNLHDTVDYVGIQTCKGCHSDIYHSFIETGMGQSFHEAKIQYSKADFQSAKPVFDKKNNLYYYPMLRGEDLYIQEFRIVGRDTTHNRIEKITHIIGSGHHTNSHFWTDGKHLYQAPLTYYTQKKVWDLPPGYESYNARFSRKIDIECMSCHTGMPKMRDGSVNIFDHLPLGIDCERCHGPGELHVNEKRSGIIIDTSKQADYSIVNPKRLPFKLQVDICQRCHLQGNNVLNPGKKFTDFKPGMHLDSVFTVFMPKTNGPQGFVMAGHAERFQQSACFIKSNKNQESYNPNLNFTCINCHNPHVSVRKTNTAKFNQTCIGCHSTNSTRSQLFTCTDTKGKVGSNCIVCHMPASDTRDIPHVTVHDHKIQRPGKPSIKQPVIAYNSKNGFGETTGELWAVNNKSTNLSMEAMAYFSYFERFDPNKAYVSKGNDRLQQWKSKESIPDKTEPAFWESASPNKLLWLETAVHGKFVEQNAGELIGLVTALGITPEQPGISKINDPWFFYRIANAYQRLEQWHKALPWFIKLMELRPYDSDFSSETADIYIRLNQLDKAIALLNQILSRQPKHENSRLNLAFAYAGKSDWPLVQLWCNRTLELNPDNVEAHNLLIKLYEATGNQASAVKHKLILANLPR